MPATCRPVRNLGTLEGLTDALGYIEDQDDVIAEVSGVLAALQRYLDAPGERGRDVLQIDVRQALRTIDDVRADTRWVLGRLRNGKPINVEPEVVYRRRLV